MKKSMKVKIVDETPTKVTIMLIAANRSMPVPRDKFEKRIEEGVYELVGGETN